MSNLICFTIHILFTCAYEEVLTNSLISNYGWMKRIISPQFFFAFAFICFYSQRIFIAISLHQVYLVVHHLNNADDDVNG